jgi:hypothetical protein
MWTVAPSLIFTIPALVLFQKTRKYIRIIKSLKKKKLWVTISIQSTLEETFLETKGYWITIWRKWSGYISFAPFLEVTDTSSYFDCFQTRKSFMLMGW